MRTQATFRLAGPQDRTSAHVSALLGLTPSRSREAGTPVSANSAITHDESLWSLSSSPGPQDGVELADQLRVLLDQLEPVTAQLWELVGAGYLANWFCYLGSYSTEHAAELDRDTLKRLLALPGELWLDVYPAEPHDEDGSTPSLADLTRLFVTLAGPCRHCGFETVYSGERLFHATPDGGAGNRGCRANLFYFDEQRWLQNPADLKGKTASLPRHP